MLNKAIWFLKQLLPLTYVSEYGEAGNKTVSVWRMWFGKCFSIRKWEVR